jgi:hypothetical protein
MVNKRGWLGILVMILVFGMAVIGCDDNPGDNGPKWVAATGEYAQPMTGTVAGSALTFTDWIGEQWTLTKNGGGLNGVWYSVDEYLKLTISEPNWTMAVSDEGGDGPEPVSRAAKSYFDFAKGTLAVNGSTVTFITTHVIEGEEPSGPSEPEQPEIIDKNNN